MKNYPQYFFSLLAWKKFLSRLPEKIRIHFYSLIAWFSQEWESSIRLRPRRSLLQSSALRCNSHVQDVKCETLPPLEPRKSLPRSLRVLLFILSSVQNSKEQQSVLRVPWKYRDWCLHSTVIFWCWIFCEKGVQHEGKIFRWEIRAEAFPEWGKVWSDFHEQTASGEVSPTTEEFIFIPLGQREKKCQYCRKNLTNIYHLVSTPFSSPQKADDVIRI